MLGGGAREGGWEGVIAKDATSPYVHSRSRDWLKFKCVNRQELVVGDTLERKTPPFADDADLPSKDVHWITPKLVAEVGFTEWTDDLNLRHPRFEGLRHDKDAEDVVRETPS